MAIPPASSSSLDPSPPAATPPSPPIDTDLLCLRCGYNLRTRLPSDRCPECNLPVRESVEATALPPRFFQKLAAAAAFLAVAYFLAASFSVVTLFRQVFGLSDRTGGIDLLVNTARLLVAAPTFALAYLLLLHSVPSRLRHRLVLTLFAVSLAMFLLAHLFAALLVVDRSGAVPGLLRQGLPYLITLYGLYFVLALSSLMLQIFAYTAMREAARLPQLADLRGPTLRLFTTDFVMHGLLMIFYLYSYTSLLLGVARAPREVGLAITALRLLVVIALLIYWASTARRARHLAHTP